MRSIKLLLMGRQRPLQFSEDCGGFDFLGTALSRAGICLLNDQVEPGLHFALFPGKSKRAAILRCGYPWDQGHVRRVAVGRYAPLVPPSHLPTPPPSPKRRTPPVHLSQDRQTAGVLCAY